MIGKTETVHCPKCGETAVYMADFTQDGDKILIFWGCGSCLHEWETHETMKPSHYDFFGIPRPDDDQPAKSCKPEACPACGETHYISSYGIDANGSPCLQCDICDTKWYGRWDGEPEAQPCPWCGFIHIDDDNLLIEHLKKKIVKISWEKETAWEVEYQGYDHEQEVNRLDEIIAENLAWLCDLIGIEAAQDWYQHEIGFGG